MKRVRTISGMPCPPITGQVGLHALGIDGKNILPPNFLALAMTQAEIEQMLITTICAVQEESGREQVEVLPTTRPLVDIPDFDSLNGVEVTVDALVHLNIEVKFNNVLANGDKPLTVAEAAERLFKCVTEGTE